MKFKNAPLVLLAVISMTSIASAATLDLTTSGASGSFSANDLFQQISPSSTGTGVIHSFVRISTNQDIVQGYNTDARPLQFDENTSPNFTRSLLLTNVPIVTIDGTAYRQFLLDINQTGTDPLLSLNELQLFLGNAPNLSGATVAAGTGLLSFGANATLIYDMDAAADNTVELNYNLNTGSGSGDMFFYVANSLFTGANQYVYLYSSFGSPNNNNDGFEEWAVLLPSGTPFEETPVPEPGTLVLLGSGLALAARRFRQKKIA